MTKLRVNCFSVSIDGYGAGPGQDLDHPMGVGGMQLHEWVFPTRTFQAMFGKDGGTTGIDDDFAARGMEGIGAWILGRNMFGPIRGPWTDDAVEGLVGRQPALSHAGIRAHPSRPAADRDGRRHDFPFCDGRHSRRAARAKEAAGARDVRRRRWSRDDPAISESRTGRQMHLAISPVLLGRGESLLADLDLVRLGYRCSEHSSSAAAMHVVLTKA